MVYYGNDGLAILDDRIKLVTERRISQNAENAVSRILAPATSKPILNIVKHFVPKFFKRRGPEVNNKTHQEKEVFIIVNLLAI